MTTNVVSSALRANGYYLDAFNNILYMTAPYEKKSNIYGTTEYKLVCDILAQYPDVQISIQKKSRKHTLSYDMIRNARPTDQAASGFHRQSQNGCIAQAAVHAYIREDGRVHPLSGKCK